MSEFLHRLSLHAALRRELILASLLINLLGLASSLYTIQVLNRYLALGVNATLVTLTVGVVVAILFEVMLRNARLLIAQWLCAKADQHLADELFESGTRGQYALLEQLPVAARREILGGHTTVQQCFNAPNLVSLLDAPFAIVFLVVLVMLSPWLALVALLIIAAVAAVSLLAQRDLKEPMEEHSRAAMQLAGHQQSLAGAGEMVRAFAASAPLKQKWNALTTELAGIRARINKLQHVVQNATYTGTMVMSVAIMGFGAREVLAGNLDVGSLIGANILASRALAAITRALGLGEPIGRGQRAMELIRQMCSIPKERAEGMSLAEFKGAMRFDDLAFAYPRQPVPILERFDFEVTRGSVVAVSGANGSGKTTMTRLLVGLLEPTRGRLLADGMDIRQADPGWWRRQICYLPQEPVFFDGTLRENLSVLCPEVSDEAILQQCRELAVGPFVEGSPEGLSMQVRNGGGAIPVGIRRRLALVRALLGKGQLVVLDDPTEGVDAEGIKAIAALLNRLAREERTIFLMSNEPFILSAAQVIVDLNQKPIPGVVKAALSEAGISKPPEGRP